MKRNDSKGCFLSLLTPLSELNKTLVRIDKTYALATNLTSLGIEEIKGNFDLHFLPLPATLELLETIVSLDSYNYYIIDNLTLIDEKLNPIFSLNKNYQKLLQHLKLIATSLNKPIILLSHYERDPEYNPSILYHLAKKEKYIDHIITLYLKNPVDIYDGDCETVIDIVRSDSAVTKSEFHFNYDHLNKVIS